MRVAWLAPYPVETLAPPLVLARRKISHPCSWIVALSEAMAQRPDVELHLVTESACVPRSQVVRLGNITFHVLREAVPLTYRGWPGWLPWIAGRTRLVTRFCRVLRQIAPDIVHAHGTEHCYAEAGVDSGFPCVVSIQGVMAEIARVWPAVGQRKRVRREVHCVRQGRYFMCRTAFDSGFVRGVNPSARIFFVQEAVRPEFFAGQWELNDQHTVLFVGAALPHKGLNVLLQSMTKLPQVRLRIVGVEATRLWVGKCRRLGIAERVEFLGFRTAAEVAGEHRRAQVFVLPSRIENSPNALTEAMVSGMPVVATAVGGVPSLVEHGRTGILVPPEDPVRLAEAILDLLENPDKRAALGRAAQAVARVRHRPDTVAQQTVFAYKEIVEDYRRR